MRNKTVAVVLITSYICFLIYLYKLPRPNAKSPSPAAKLEVFGGAYGRN